MAELSSGELLRAYKKILPREMPLSQQTETTSPQIPPNWRKDIAPHHIRSAPVSPPPKLRLIETSAPTGNVDSYRL